MSKHSPAPWYRDVLFIRDSDGEYVADIKLDPDDPVAEANARLIAAAPDLLRAAVHFGACDFAGESIEFRCPYCVAARAAIAKAES